MTWAQRLKRVFMRYIPVPHPYGAAYGCANRLSCRFVNIDIETCRECGGAVKVIACIEDPVVIEKILTHLNGKADSVGTGLLPEKFAGSRSTASSGFAKGELLQCRCLGDTDASERADHGGSALGLQVKQECGALQGKPWVLDEKESFES